MPAYARSLLLAEIKLLLRQLADLGIEDNLDIMSTEELEKLTVADLTSVTNQLQDVLRTIGGVRRVR